MMKLCVVSSKECWQNAEGRWVTSGGFPMQMAALASLFSDLTLVVLAVAPQKGGALLPENARVVALRPPQTGSARPSDTGRKLSLIARLPYYLGTIRREIARADVVHTPVPGDIGLLGMWVALLLGKHLIVRYGSSWPNTPQMTLMNGVTKFFTRTFAGRRNVMLATGAGEQPPAPLMHWIFSTAISRTEFQQVQPDLNRCLSNPPRLVFIGRLAPEKGLDNLLYALALLKERGAAPLPQVALIGDGPRRKQLTALAEQLGVQDQIEFAGQMSRPALLQRLCQADLAVLPSLTESFMKARLDAMLCATPVITTEVGFGRELIGQDGERGWLVETGSPESLANTLQAVLNTPQDWPAIRARCRSFVEAYTLEAWAEQIGQICARQWQVPFIEGKLQA